MQGLGSVQPLVLNRAWAASLLGPKLGGISVVLGHAVLFGVPVFEVCLLETPLTSGLQTTLEIEPETFCL